MTIKRHEYFYKGYTIRCDNNFDGIAEYAVQDGVLVIAHFTIYKGHEELARGMAEAFVDKQPDVSEYEA